MTAPSGSTHALPVFDPSLELHAAVREGGRTVAAAMGNVAEGRAMAAAVVRDNKLWSPDSPNLMM
jgi:hypothetical protein